MFYYFFESRTNKNDPVVIWLTGGPGCSSELALFYENGPFNIANNLSLSWNDYGWDKVIAVLLLLFWWPWFQFPLIHDNYASSINKFSVTIDLWQASNIIFVDQPTGTGFSYTTEETDIRHDETGVSNDLYDFLQVRLLSFTVLLFISLFVNIWSFTLMIWYSHHLSLSLSLSDSVGIFQRASSVDEKWFLHNWRILCWALHSSISFSGSPRKQKERRNSYKPQGMHPMPSNHACFIAVS